MNCGTNYLWAMKQAQANATYFMMPYYVVSTTIGLCVEREEPKDRSSIVFLAKPQPQ